VNQIQGSLHFLSPQLRGIFFLCNLGGVLDCFTSPNSGLLSVSQVAMLEFKQSKSHKTIYSSVNSIAVVTDQGESTQIAALLSLSLSRFVTSATGVNCARTNRWIVESLEPLVGTNELASTFLQQETYEHGL
jgi:hypothetical protein